MKKLILLGLLFFIIGINASFAQEIVSSHINKVTLFTNQALVEREAQVNVEKGMNEILLELNAFKVDRDSIQARVFGEGELYSVQFRKVYLKQAPQKKIKELETKIEELKDKKASILNQKRILKKQEKFLDSLIDFSDIQIATELKTSLPKAQDLRDILKFLSENLDSITDKREKFDKKIEELEEEIKVLEKELSSIKVPSQKVKKGIQILFKSNKDQRIKIKASYLVYHCNWHPLYKVNVPLNLGQTELIMFSKIRQKTGEDWKDIKLLVSNVIPLKGVRLPKLGSWILDVRKEHRRYGKGKPWPRRDLMKMQLGREEMAPEAKLPPAKFTYAKKKRLPLSFEYELPQTLNIESKDKETLLPLFSKTIKGEFFYRVIPKVNPLTFLVCKASSDKELLSGPLNVYFGSRFIGKTYLSEKKPGQEFYLNLGADREVKVKREKIKDKIEETFFGKLERKTVIRKLEYKITTENLKHKPITLKVLDNIPVSRTDKIEVKDVKLTPEPDQIDYQDKEGVYLWEISLEPKQKKEINIQFKITYPKDIPIPGL